MNQLSKEEFLEKLKTNSEFNSKYGRKHITEGKQILPPCHYAFQCYTRLLTWEEQVEWVLRNTEVELENVYIVEEIAKETTPKRALSLSWNQRSADFFIGAPFNITSYGLLLSILGKICNMVPDQLIGNFGDTHLYLNHLDQANKQIPRSPFKLPKLLHAKSDDFWKSFDVTMFGHLGVTDFSLEGYQSHPVIKAPLSN